MKIKVGDEVVVMQGKDKRKKGKVEKIIVKKKQVLVAGVNVYKKHIKKSGRVPSGIIDVTKPLPVASLVLVCPKCNLKTKVGFLISDGQKIRICKKCKQQI